MIAVGMRSVQRDSRRTLGARVPPAGEAATLPLVAVAVTVSPSCCRDLPRRQVERNQNPEELTLRTTKLVSDMRARTQSNATIRGCLECRIVGTQRCHTVQSVFLLPEPALTRTASRWSRMSHMITCRELCDLDVARPELRPLASPHNLS